MRDKLRAVLALMAAGWIAGAASAQSPLSAIDWLSDSVTTPVASPAPRRPNEAATSTGAGIDVITVTPLDAVSADAVGLLPVSVTGLPANLWGATASPDLATAFGALDAHLLPAMQDLVLTLLLAELAPPADSGPEATLFLARIDALLALGAVEQAKALLERAGPDDPARFRRWFDASLLTGTEDAACDFMRDAPGLAPTMPARIFCLARGGDWNAAALTLETGRALGHMTGAEDALLTRFLDPELFEGMPPLPVPARPSPLEYRLYEAIGEALPTTTLPLAFAQADLRDAAGWKAQIEAAERLARSRAIEANHLLGLYTERKPAASGGVWDRVAKVQAFETALRARNPSQIAATLPPVWAAMERAELETVFASLFAKPLGEVDLADDTAALAFRIRLLGETYETVARDFEASGAEEQFLQGLAQGDVADQSPTTGFGAALADGFTASDPPEQLAAQVARGDLGAAVLQAIALAEDGARGNADKLSDAIALFRSVGLEDVARRLALQVMILDRRG